MNSPRRPRRTSRSAPAPGRCRRRCRPGSRRSDLLLGPARIEHHDEHRDRGHPRRLAGPRDQARRRLVRRVAVHEAGAGGRLDLPARGEVEAHLAQCVEVQRRVAVGGSRGANPPRTLVGPGDPRPSGEGLAKFVRCAANQLRSGPRGPSKTRTADSGRRAARATGNVRLKAVMVRPRVPELHGLPDGSTIVRGPIAGAAGPNWTPNPTATRVGRNCTAAGAIPGRAGTPVCGACGGRLRI